MSFPVYSTAPSTTTVASPTTTTTTIWIVVAVVILVLLLGVGTFTGRKQIVAYAHCEAGAGVESE